MMKIDINLDEVQTLLMNFAKNHGMTEERVHEEWVLSYQDPLQDTFEKRLSRLLEAMQLYKEATVQEDKITARCALLYACVAAGLISDDFGALEKDLKKAMLLDKTVIPENYEIPEHYGVSQR